MLLPTRAPGKSSSECNGEASRKWPQFSLWFVRSPWPFATLHDCLRGVRCVVPVYDDISCRLVPRNRDTYVAPFRDTVHKSLVPATERA